MAANSRYITPEMFARSLVGAGSPVFAVLAYVIAHMESSPRYGATVELNPKLLAFVIGDAQDVIEVAIRFMCQPGLADTESHRGRLLVKVGEWEYMVVCPEQYRGYKLMGEAKLL